MKTILLSLALALAALQSQAVVIDITAAGSSGTVNGATFVQGEQQPAGTGVFDSFLKIGRTGTSGEGYNTDLNAVFADTFTSPTRDVTLGELALSSDGQFVFLLLDINQEGSGLDQNLSILDLKIYVRSAALTSASTFADLNAPPSIKIFDLDAGADNQVNTRNVNGSGVSDSYVKLPVSFFQNQGFVATDHLYVYSKMGSPGQDPVFANNDGSEEWGLIRLGPGINPLIPDTPVPEPASMLFGMALLGVISSSRLRRAIRIVNGEQSA